MYELVPREEIEGRLDRLRRKLREAEIDGALIVQNTDLYYFSGTSQQAHLFVPADGPEILMVRKYYPRAAEESPLTNIAPIKSFRELPAIITGAVRRPLQRLMMELDVLPASEYFRYKKVFKDSEILDGSNLIRSLRSVKSEWEVRQIQAAGKLLEEVFNRTSSLIEAGKREIDLAADIESMMRRLGHQGIIRMRSFNGELLTGVIVSGQSGAVRSSFNGPVAGKGLSPFYPTGASERSMAAGEPVLVDLVAGINGYCCDVARTFCVGFLSESFRQAFDVCLQIQNELAPKLRPGVSCNSLYNEAIDIAAKTGYKDMFMGPDDDSAGFIAHGVGLEIDEWPVVAPRFAMELVAGNVIALEPKIVMDCGVAGVENTWLVSDHGGVRMCNVQDSML